MSIEIVVLFVYFVGLIGMGLFWKKKSAKSEDYMLGGRSMGPLVTALTLQTTAMSGYMFMGGPALAYAVGWFALFYAVGDAGSGLFNVTILGRRMRRLSQLLDSISPIEYLEKRYESTAVKVIACAIAIFGLGGYVLAQFLSAGKTLQSLFDFPFAAGLIIGVAVIMLYTFIGGYFAVAWTDVIQGFIMIGALITILILSLVELGGLGGLNAQLGSIDETYLSVWGKDLQYENAYGIIIGAILIYLIGYMGLPHCVNKHMAMGSPKVAKTTVVYATIWTQLFCFTPYILGLCGIVLLPNIADPEMVIPELANMMFPGVVAAIVLTAIMSAIMSTVAALLLLVGTIWSVDLYKRKINPKATDKQVVIMSKVAILTVGVIGIVIAIVEPPGVFGLVVFSFGVMASAFLPSYICAIWWKKANATGSVASMVLGGGTAFLWTALELEGVTGMHSFLVGVIVSTIAMIIGSYVGKPNSPEMLALVDKAAGKRIDVSVKIEAAATKDLATENIAVSKHLKASEFLGRKNLERQRGLEQA